MSQQSLRAFTPDAVNTSDDSFRCDQATIAKVLDWWEQNPARVTTSEVAETERKRIWSLLRVAMGACLVLDRRPFHLDAFIRSQLNVEANNTRRRWNTTIQQPFNEAELQGLIIKNPFRGLSYPEGDEGRDWTDDELHEVLTHASRAFCELVIGMRLSSLRPLEACELGWRQISFDRGDIKFDNHKSRYRTKTPAYVPLNQPLIDLLNEIKARHHSSDRVFLTTKRLPWTREYADCAFRRLRDKLGLPADLKLHGCRHTFATGAIMNDVGVMHLQQIMRHRDIRTTQKYVHLANKTDHLAPSMNQAVSGLNLPKVGEDTPLFDGLE